MSHLLLQGIQDTKRVVDIYKSLAEMVAIILFLELSPHFLRREAFLLCLARGFNKAPVISQNLNGESRPLGR